MTNKLDVLCQEYNFDTGKEYSMSKLLHQLGFRVRYDKTFDDNSSQIIVSDCHGNYEMTHSLDSREITVPDHVDHTNPIIATLLASWLDLKVTDNGEYRPSMTMHTNINMIKSLPSEKKSAILSLNRQLLLPDRCILSQLDKTLCHDPIYMQHTAQHFARKHKISLPIAFSRVTEVVNKYYPIDILKK